MKPVVPRQYKREDPLKVTEAGFPRAPGQISLCPFFQRALDRVLPGDFMGRKLTAVLVLATLVVVLPAFAENPGTGALEYPDKRLEEAAVAEERGVDSLEEPFPQKGDAAEKGKDDSVSATLGDTPPSPTVAPGREAGLSGEKALAELQEWLEEEPEEKGPAQAGSENAESGAKGPGKAQDAAKRPSGTSTLYGYPERKNFIRISKTDVNRFVCENGDVTGTIYSEDKGIEVKKAGRNAFLRIRPNSFAFEHPFEFYVICGDELYTFIVEGDWISASKVVLKDGAGKVEEALDFFRGKTREGNIVEIIKKSWNEKWEDGWREIPRYRTMEQTGDYKIVWYKTVDTGTPWVLELFVIEGIGNPVKLREENFLDGDVVAVSCLEPLVAKGRLGKVAVIREKASP
jgi:hypothetical protein